MHDRPVPLSPFVLVAGCVVALALVAALTAGHGRPRPQPGGDAHVFRYGLMLRALALGAAIVLPLATTAVLRFYPPARSPVGYVVAVYLGFAALTIPLVWEAGRYYVLLTPAGLEARSAWRGVRTIAWADLAAVRFHPTLSWFEFMGPDGTRARVPSFVAGLNELLGVVESHVPPALLKGARTGYAHVGRPFPALPDGPVLEARRPRRAGSW